MMTAVRQTVTVSPEGRLDVAVPELSPGTVTEVIVLVEAASGPSAADSAISARLAALDELQRSMALTPEAAAAWVREIRAERDAWPERGGPLVP
jgi:hypothetical protein